MITLIHKQIIAVVTWILGPLGGSGHMTKMAAMPIYGKNPSKIFFSGTAGPIA